MDGVLWKITEACEKNLDFYEGFPSFYGKETIQVKDQDGCFKGSVCIYDERSLIRMFRQRPSKFYLDGILEGCLETDLPTKAVMDAVKRTRQEMKKRKKSIYKINVTAEGHLLRYFTEKYIYYRKENT